MDDDERDYDLVREAYEQRRGRASTLCQCGNPDWPGSCPGSAACPCCQSDDDSDADLAPCTRCGEAVRDGGNEGCRDPACPGQGANR